MFLLSLFLLKKKCKPVTTFLQFCRMTLVLSIFSVQFEYEKNLKILKIQDGGNNDVINVTVVAMETN